MTSREQVINAILDKAEMKGVSHPAPSSRVRELTARPTCAVCDRLVERMTEEERDHAGVVRFTAYCHGQSEAIEIPDHAAGLKSISFGTAFAGGPRRLEAGDRG